MNYEQKWYWIPGVGVRFVWENERPAGAVELPPHAARDVMDRRRAMASKHQDEARLNAAEARDWEQGDYDVVSPDITRIVRDSGVDIAVKASEGGPSREWIRKAAEIEAECGGNVSVGGLAADMGWYKAPSTPDTKGGASDV